MKDERKNTDETNRLLRNSIVLALLLDIFSSFTFKLITRAKASYFTASANSKHAGLCTHTADLGTRAIRTQAREQLIANVALDAHGARVYFEDVCAPFQVRKTELDLAIEAPGTQQCRIERVGPA